MPVSVLQQILGLASYVLKRDTKICRKCRAIEGAVFCERAMLGEPGACVFDTVPPCRKCGSAVACFGLPCELADRIAAMRGKAV